MTLRVLASYHYHQGSDLAAVTAAYPGPVEVFADSGAYSAHTGGVEIHLPDYAAWLRRWQHVITVAATLDVIGDPAATARNTAALEDMGLRVLPVFHIGTPWPVLDALCVRYPYIALGGMVPHSARPDEVMRWLIRCFQVARAHGTVFHGFGQTRFPIMSALPFYSVDSSSWTTGARYAEIVLWNARKGVTQVVKFNQAANVRRHAALLRNHGADPAIVARPGFGFKAGKSAEQYRAEQLVTYGTPAVAYTRLGAWLTRRHRVPAPAGWSGAGTKLYLAGTDTTQFAFAARALATDHAKDHPS